MEQLSEHAVGTLRRRVTRTVLAAGDDRVRLNALAQRLGHLGYLVVLSGCGSQALELIAGRGFDVVLLDCACGDGGMQVLREVRGARDTADLPVLLITADAAQEIAGLAAGADDCVAQPDPFELLAARIERVLARAARLDALKRANLAIDARIAARAVELGELRAELAATQADRARLAAALGDQRLRERT
jgi:DNA-binding response OmpR family regulator